MNRRIDIDILKGIAIIAVVLYHTGALPTGYLGVDVFFVISGYLSIPSIIQKIDNPSAWGGDFRFLKNRIARLLPIVLIACLACLLIGYYGMLPDDYENLSESIVATLLFSNNILAYITTGNYWDVVNDYKPLMHTWYLGVLFEFYLFFPLFVIAVRKFGHNAILKMLFFLVLISFVIYLMPCFSRAAKFYLIPFRLFEFGIGGVFALLNDRISTKIAKGYYGGAGAFSTLLLLAIICCGWYIKGFYREVILVGVVVFTLLVIITSKHVLTNKSFRILSVLGKMSLSIYIWHQLIIAFYRYYVGSIMGLTDILIFMLLLSGTSAFSYYLIEKKIRLGRRSVITLPVIWLGILLTSLSIYANAGVVRDVPELDIKKGKHIKRNLFHQYNDRINSYDKDFPINDKINVLIIGDSFCRDWANILLESGYADSINISYVHANNSDLHTIISERAYKADVVFLNLFKDKVPSNLWKNVKKDVKVWCVGTKNFGECNGVIYSHRYNPDYYNQTANVLLNFKGLNRELKKDWGNRYIDLIEPVYVGCGKVRVFTSEGKFISHDTRHLTVAGARFYAERLNFARYFEGTKK